jgi:hypothetical protein
MSHPGGLIACGSLLQWTKENAGNLFGNVLLAELPALHRPPSLEAVPHVCSGPCTALNESGLSKRRSVLTTLTARERAQQRV